MSQPPPLRRRRHLSTIGIGSVFICPPPRPLIILPPQSVDDEDPAPEGRRRRRGDNNNDAPRSDDDDDATKYLPDQEETTTTTTTWEIIGDIKTTPEDFIVREIGWSPAAEPTAPRERVEPRGDDENGHENVAAPITAKQHNTDRKGRTPPSWRRRIAGLKCKSQSETRLDGVNEERECIDGVSSKETETETVADDQIIPTSSTINARIEGMMGSDPTVVDDLQNTSSQSSATTSMKPNPSVSHSMAHSDQNPTEGLRRILINYCLGNIEMTTDEMGENQTSQDDEGGTASNTILQQLADLQNHALEEIDYASRAALGNNMGGDTIDRGRACDKNSVWISTSQLFQGSLALLHNNGSQDWTLLHRYIRQVFPLLRTESSSVGPLDVRNEDNGSHLNVKDEDCGIIHESDFNNKSWVCALVDYTFFSVAPCLAYPRQDLLELYQFRNYGPIPALIEGGNNNRRRAGHQQCGGGFNSQSCDSREVQLDDNQDDAPSNGRGTVLLRLRPDLPRIERRAIHQTLASSRRREFDTSTTNYGQSQYADKDSSHTAIVVQWSRNALETSQKKRKRAQQTSNDVNSPQSERSPAITAVFCVLRKYQCEHQIAVTSVMRALRCRAGDVGLAGIKDMQAITYQFCTLRNVDPARAKLANNTLGIRVQLSNFIEVTGSDALLDRGKLIGNQFEIVIRHLSRVQLLQAEGDTSWKERTVPVHSSHLDAMVKRINDFGFINFYGQQRVGDAGMRSQVGVRSFDVGRAMLQRDFSNAVDLIMTGRTSEVYNPGADELNARKVWKTSGGNARETLKAFPKNRNTMVRERDLMKGLLRYNDPLEAIRCIPHNIRMFWIHAYQSYVWNRVATERIKRWGLRPVVGDLYLEKETRSNGEDGVAEDFVKVVSEPTSVNISQIVLPLPGYNIEYPQNEIGELYEEVLQGDGVQLRKGNIPEATAKGSYRKLVQRANKLIWSTVSEQGEAEPDVSDDPVVDAARLTFELESGCYATMLLRELMVTTYARDTCKMD